MLLHIIIAGLLAKSSGPVLDFLKGKSPQAARSIPLPYLGSELAWD